MRRGYVTREEMQTAIASLEDRIQKRTEAFMVEIRGLMGQIRDERQEQFLGLSESNRRMTEAFATSRQTLDLMIAEMHRGLGAFDRAMDGFNRNAEGTASRLTAIERLLPSVRPKRGNSKTGAGGRSKR